MCPSDIRLWLLAVALLTCSLPVSSQAQDAAANAAIARRMPAAVQELVNFVAIPNDAVDPADIDKNIAWAAKAFAQRDFTTQVLPTKHLPIFVAERKYPGNTQTVLFYFHLDGQPVHPAQWQQDDPYQAVLRTPRENGGYQDLRLEHLSTDFDREWRLFGRSTADDKGPIIMLLQAMDLLQEEGRQPPFHVKVVLDTEEEKGSAGLQSSLQEHREALMADYMIIMDGPVHATNQPTLTFGCRGIASVQLTTYGPVTPQHSGHFGNYAPNPAFRLARLLTSMKDEQGRVLIEGFYDGISISKEAQQVMEAVPDNEAAIRQRLQIAEAEQVGANYQESLQYPSLNVRGMASAAVGEAAATIVPATAEALFDIRLVPETEGARLVSLVREHIRQQGYTVVDHEPTAEERQQHAKLVYFRGDSGTPAFRTEIDSPMGRWLHRAIRQQYRQEPVVVRMMGGTVPIAPIIQALNIPAVLVPLVNQDNNQHSPNENLRLGNLFDGIKTCLAILSTPLEDN